MAGQARTEAQRKAKAQDARGQWLCGHSEDAGEAPQAGFGPRDQGEVRSRGKVELERREASRQPRRKRKSGGTARRGRRAVTRTSAAGRGSKEEPEDRPSHASHSLIGHVPIAVQPSSFSSSRETSLCWIPVLCGAGGGPRATVPERRPWRVEEEGSWRQVSGCPVLYSRRRVAADARGAIELWACAGHVDRNRPAGSRRVRTREKSGRQPWVQTLPLGRLRKVTRPPL